METSTANSAALTRGVDLAKKVFPLHGVDATGKIVLQRAVKRKDLPVVPAKLPKCLIGMEACVIVHV